MRVGALLGALTAGSFNAHAQEATAGGTITVRGSGCPSTAELMTALAPLLPGARLTALADTDGLVEAQVEVTETGDDIRVTAAGDSRRLAVDLHCDERARTAALWAALRLRPPTLPAIAEEPPASEGTLPPAPPPAPSRAWPLHVDLDLAGSLAGAPSEGLTSWGGALHLAVGRGPLAAVIGGGVGSPVTLALPVGSAVLWRAPLDLDLRATVRSGRFEGDAEVGLLVAVESAAGQGLYVNRSDVRAGVGIRAALRGRLRLGRVAPFAALGATVEPRPYVLFVDGMGNASTLPAWWVTGELGVSFALR